LEYIQLLNVPPAGAALQAGDPLAWVVRFEAIIDLPDAFDPRHALEQRPKLPCKDDATEGDDSTVGAYMNGVRMRDDASQCGAHAIFDHVVGRVTAVGPKRGARFGQSALGAVAEITRGQVEVMRHDVPQVIDPVPDACSAPSSAPGVHKVGGNGSKACSGNKAHSVAVRHSILNLSG
jgi:hypothetical protein